MTHSPYGAEDTPLDLSFRNDKPLDYRRFRADYPSNHDAPHCHRSPNETCATIPDRPVRCTPPAPEEDLAHLAHLSKSPGVRPFKALAKSPTLAFSDALLNCSEDVEVRNLAREFEERLAHHKRKLAAQVVNASGGCNQNMRRTQNNQDRIGDPEYMEKRKKNNESAKRSRDARRQRQDELALTVSFLEMECMKLKCQIQAISDELDGLG